MIVLRSLVFDILFYGLMAIIGILCLPLALASKGGAYWTLKLYCGLMIWLLEKVVGLKVEVRGQVPQGDVIVTSKHQSFLDILIHTRELPRPRFIMKKELKWAPLLGIYAMRIGSTPVHRGRKGETVSKMVAKEAKESGAPGQLVIYPQGTRVAPHVDVPYKVGAGVLYQRFGKTCVPAATNAGLFWGRNSWVRKPGLAIVEYLEPIPPGEKLASFLEQMEDAVENASDALMAEVGHPRPTPRPPREPRDLRRAKAGET